MEKIDIAEYQIYLGSIQDSLSEVLHQYAQNKIFILTDVNSHHHCWPLIKDCFKDRKYSVLSILPGELNKNIDSCLKVWHAMTEAQLERNSLMINLGGGMITDLGGFCASTYKRGIPFIQIPTTLLSQVDASIGGKLGIDFEGYKNHIGVFQFPKAVLIDAVFLNTLPDRELRSGYAEIIKHTLIADGDDWDHLKGIYNLRAQQWGPIIRRSLEVKRKIVLRDPYEKGERKLLNFGHTIGHAIESHYLESTNPLLHGEAIAAGMIYETRLSGSFLQLSHDKEREIINYLTSLYGPTPPISLSELLPIMQQDKKNKEGKISFSLLNDIGQSTWDILLEEKDLRPFFNS